MISELWNKFDQQRWSLHVSAKFGEVWCTHPW